MSQAVESAGLFTFKSSKIGASLRAACAITIFNSVLPFSHQDHSKFFSRDCNF